MNYEWFKAAGIRALKTFCQSAVSLISVGSMVTQLDWSAIIQISATAAVLSLLTSVAGLPEVNDEHSN